jgi:serine/threonine protein kinase
MILVSSCIVTGSSKPSSNSHLQYRPRLFLPDNAHILNWNPRNNSYCKYFIWIGGDYRSPEELNGLPVDDKSDVWPMGANIFVLLSGLYPYYSLRETKLIENTIANGTRPYLDPRYKDRSIIEGSLFDIMQQCFEVDPVKRDDIFEVVRHLRGLKELIMAQRARGDFVPYNGNVILRELSKRVIFAEKEKQRQKEDYLSLHGNLDGYEEASFYGEYEAGDDGSEHGASTEAATSEHHDDEYGDDGE